MSGISVTDHSGDVRQDPTKITYILSACAEALKQLELRRRP